jgi:hypothetical protein
MRAMRRHAHALDAALRYAAEGWSVFPLAARSKLPLIAAKDGGRGLYDATTDPAMIRAWFTQYPTANLGLRTGLIFDVVDLDGLRATEALEKARQGRDKLRGPMVQTPHGWHVLVQPTGLGNRAGVLPGLDFRGQGGYTVAPPSIVEAPDLSLDRRQYKWFNSSEPLRALPTWLLDLLQRTRELPVRVADLPVGPRTTAYGRAALRREIESLSRALPGTRNDRLNKAAFALGQLVGAGALEEEETVTALTDAGLRLGLGERECERTIDSGLNAGMGAPRSLAL